MLEKVIEKIWAKALVLIDNKIGEKAAEALCYALVYIYAILIAWALTK
nr:MAG TPA: hypothetical protein [Caudoviricetes sp.]